MRRGCDGGPGALAVTVVCTMSARMELAASTPDGTSDRGLVGVLTYRWPGAASPEERVMTRLFDNGSGRATSRRFLGDAASLARAARNDLAAAVRAVAAEGRHEALVVVPPPGSHPAAVAAAVTEAAPTAVVSLVALVDATTVLDDFDGRSGAVIDRGFAAGWSGDAGRLAAEQIERAEQVVLAATGEVHVCDALQLDVLLRRLNPSAHHVTVSGHVVSVAEVWSRGCSLETDRLGRGWPRGLFALPPREVSSSELGVTETFCRARRPLHPVRLFHAVDDLVAGVVRSRGWFWVASCPGQRLSWDHVGGAVRVAPDGRWRAELPSSPRERQSLVSPDPAEPWDPCYGDRTQELALIGLHAEPARIVETFAGCLLTDAELALGRDVWRTWPDPFTRHADGPRLRA
ncbi:GTP-binding protein [Frankia sp. AgB1.9]|nr:MULTISPECIES: GTP-binding protein [unclassified Frankia]MBL7553018.1 GTP-binding protein [Frankia sp. AgB1.9]